MILVSVMRDSESYLERFYEQVESLNPRAVVIAEGDSTDRTWPALHSWKSSSAPPALLLKVEHGGPRFGSVDHPLRWRQLGAVCEVALTAAVRELEEDEPLVYVESDLIWAAATLEKLATHTSMYPAVAPMSMYNNRFYDTWAYRKNGVQFPRNPPYFPGWSDEMMHQIDSNGSCFALSWDAAQHVHFSPVDCILGIGRTLRQNGFSLWLDPTLQVRHP